VQSFRFTPNKNPVSHKYVIEFPTVQSFLVGGKTVLHIA